MAVNSGDVGDGGPDRAAPAPALAVRERTPSPPSASTARKRRCYGASSSLSFCKSATTSTKKMDAAECEEGSALTAATAGQIPPAGMTIDAKNTATPVGICRMIGFGVGSEMEATKKALLAVVDAARTRLSDIEKIVEPMVASGAVEPAVEVLGTAIAEHPHCPETQRYCYSALMDLARPEGSEESSGGDSSEESSDSDSSGGDDSFDCSGAKAARVADAIAAARDRCLPEDVVRGAERCMEDADLQESALRLLWLLLLHERHRPAVAAAGGCGYIVKALVWHADSSEAVAEAAFRVIKPLSVDFYAASIEQTDAMRAVAHAMSEYPANADLQAQGCSVLSNLAVDVKNQRVAIATPKEVGAILRALDFHPENLNVQKHASFALMHLAFAAANAEVIATSEFSASELLEAAARRFPDECRKGCKITLKRMAKAKGSGKCSSSTPNSSSSVTLPQHMPNSSRSGNAALHHSSSPAVRDHHPPIHYPPRQNPCPGVVGNNLEIISERKVFADSSLAQQRHAHRIARGYRETSSEDPQSGSVATTSQTPPPPPTFSDDGAAENTGSGGLADELLKNAVRSGQSGEYASACSQFEIVLSMKMSMLGPDAASSDLVDLLNCLGYACAAAGDASGAIDKYGQSLVMQRKLLRNAPDDEAVANTLSSLGVLHMQTRKLRAAEAFLTEAVRTKRAFHRRLREKATTDSGTAPANFSLCNELESLGDLERLKGRPDQAEEMYKLAARWQASDPAAAKANTLPIAGLTAKMGLLEAARGDHYSAQQATKAALNAKRRAYGPGAKNADLAATLCGAGYVDAAAGDLIEATTRYEESLDMQRLLGAVVTGGDDDAGEPRRQKRPLPRSAKLARTLTSLGVLSAKRGRRSAARSYLEEALDAKRSLLGEMEAKDEETSWEFLDMLQTLGEVCDEDEDAEVYFEGGLEHASLLYDEAIEPARLESEDHSYTRIFHVQMKIADLLLELGLVVLRRGEIESARKRCAKAVEIYQRCLLEASDWNPTLHTTKFIRLLNNMGCILAIMGDYPTAINKYGLSLKLQRSIKPGPFTIEMAQTENSLGVLYFKNGDNTLSEHFLAGALLRKRKIYGPDSDFSVSIAETLRNLGEVCMALKKFEKAEAYFEKAFSIYYHALSNNVSSGSGDGGAAISDVYSKLGKLAGRRGDVFSAQEHFEAALEIKRDLYEPDDANLDLVGTLNDLGYACAAQGDYGAAIQKYEESLRILQCIHGSDAECEDITKTTRSLNLLEKIMHKLQACSS